MRQNLSPPWIIVAMVLLAAGWGPPSRVDRPSDLALQAKGLKKVGTTYILGSEQPVLAKMNEARQAYAGFAALTSQQLMHQELAERTSHLAAQQVELQSQLDELNQRITDSGNTNSGPGPMSGGGPGRTMPGGSASVTPLTIERDQLKAMLAATTAQQKTIRNQSPQAKDTATLDTNVKQADETNKTLLADLRTQVDAVTKAYANLAADDAVKQALAESKKENPKLHLGPSDAFLAGARALAKSERVILNKTTPVSTTKKKTRTRR